MPKTRIVLYHVLAWAIFYSLPILSIWSGSAEVIKLPRPPSLFWVSSLLQVLIFYLNAYWLMPNLFLKKKYWVYSLSILAILILRALILYSLPFPEMPDFGRRPPFTNRDFIPIRGAFLFFSGLVTIVLSSGFRIFIEHRHNEQLYKERETTNLRSELRFLRSQISPHFLFNVLNSLTALARKKSDLLEPSLLKLSELMRYTIYETDQDFIPLKSEIDYIQSYINLQQMRFDENIRLRINIDEARIQHQQIAPMLLIPLIENAFKYSTQVLDAPYIELSLYLTEKNRLVLALKNSCTPTVYQDESENPSAAGLGLNNLQRRLELIYPHRFQFKAQRLGNEFMVALEIDL